MDGYGLREHFTYTDERPGAHLYVVDAATAAQRWQASAGTASQRFQDGVNATTKDPGQAAAAAQNKMLTGVTNAVTSGYWARRVQEGGALANWKAQTIAKAQNFATGIQASGNKYQAGYTQFWNYMTPYYQSIISNPDPKGRMNAWFDAASAYQKP